MARTPTNIGSAYKIPVGKLVECITCQGQYVGLQSDNGRYFHACPPLTNAVEGESVPHPNMRDETPVADIASDIIRPRLAGSGVRDVVRIR